MNLEDGRMVLGVRRRARLELSIWGIGVSVARTRRVRPCGLHCVQAMSRDFFLKASETIYRLSRPLHSQLSDGFF